MRSILFLLLPLAILQTAVAATNQRVRLDFNMIVGEKPVKFPKMIVEQGKEVTLVPLNTGELKDHIVRLTVADTDPEDPNTVHLKFKLAKRIDGELVEISRPEMVTFSKEEADLTYFDNRRPDEAFHLTVTADRIDQ